MSTGRFESPKDIADWLRSHLTNRYDLSYPYARKWETGGCTAKYALWAWPADRVLDLATGVYSSGHPVSGVDDGVLVALPNATIKVSANRSSPGDGVPDAYSFFGNPSQLPGYTGNSPEVVVEVLRAYGHPPPPQVDSDVVVVGFPGRPESDLTYIGSWEWDVHGEARGAEFVRRATAATLTVIDGAKAKQ
ncbi:hypothetical protein BH09ACT8_BH09ACT8_28920 [soil metagenome]